MYRKELLPPVYLTLIVPLRGKEPFFCYGFFRYGSKCKEM